MIVKFKLYAHRDKDSNWHEWERLWEANKPPESLSGPDNAAGKRFAYTGMEIEMDAEVNMASGEVKVTHFQGQPLPKPVSV